MPVAIRKLVTMADEQYNNQQYQSSLASLERALRIKPRQPEVWTRMAKIHLELQQYRQAIEYAKRANNYVRNNDALKQYNQQIIDRASTYGLPQ